MLSIREVLRMTRVAFLMIDLLMLAFVKMLLWLRYRVRLGGLDKIIKKGRERILFLPNHPALIDPVILMSQLYSPFKVRALADSVQIDRFMIRRFVRRVGVIEISDVVKDGSASIEQVRQVLRRCVEKLNNGENLLLYPAGRVYRQYLEDIRGNSAVERILQQVPDVRIVLVRTRGLWGSNFSWALGQGPSVAKVLWKGVRSLLLSGVFFAPRRDVSIELTEVNDLPIDLGRNAINEYLQNFYNENADHNTYVPYTIWEAGGVRELPEPELTAIEGDSREVPEGTRQIVREYLEELTGCLDFDDDDSLAIDLGMDSLSRADLIVWLEKEFGFAQGDTDSLQTVGDVMLAAWGEAVSIAAKNLKKVPVKWFKRVGRPGRPAGLDQMTITQAFLTQAKRSPDEVIFADEIAGVRTYRDLVLMVSILKKQIAPLPGDYVGIMMPASVAANILYLAALFAGKIPVMINWTLGRKNITHCLEAVDVKHILTAKAVVSRIQSQGIDLADLNDRFVFLEDIRAGLSKWDKLTAWIHSRFSWSQVHQADVGETAVVLFTSGSENVPKVVPLTHRNMLSNVSDAYECFTLEENDSILGILPPFHSFGLTVSILLPLCLSVPAVYYPNPNDSGSLTKIIEAYQVTLLIGTPTFLHGIVRASSANQLKSLRLVVSGAEKCPPRVYDALAQRCPQTVVLEGYGVTECSPVISVNRQDDPHCGTIGKVLASLEYVLVDPETNQRVGCGREGVLLVRGPSVFDGYLNYDGPSPFVPFENKQWYRTGDLVVEDEQHVLTFAGRLKRFIKLGGEMISLPGIESVLETHYLDNDDKGPILAVVATPVDERPEIVLFTVKNLDRAQVNQRIREAHLSGLHNIRRVIRVDELPLLGTGKTDYRALMEKLGSDAC